MAASSSNVNSSSMAAVNRQNDQLQSKKAGMLNVFKRSVQIFDAFGPDENRNKFVASLDRKIGKLEQKKAHEKGLVQEGEVMFEPRKVKGMLTDAYTIAPNPEAVEDVKRKLPEGSEAVEAYVEVVLQSLLQAEDLADAFYQHKEAYLEDGHRIRMRTYHDDGAIAADVTYDVKMIETTPGLNAFILTPLDTPEGIIPEIKMIFVGTKDMPGIKRDAEKGAAGNLSFAPYEQKLLNSLDEVVRAFPNQDIKMSVIGHSLGGADSQRMVSKIISTLISPPLPEEESSGLRSKNIYLRLETSAAPTLTRGQCATFLENLREATTPREGRPHFEFSTIASIYNLDIVPTCGEQHILADPEVLSLCTQAIIVYVRLNLFQHESGLFKNPGEISAGGMQILHTNHSPDRNESVVRERMVAILNRNFRINVR